MTHAWCRDIPRDEAVRAAEDGRSGPLPTLEEAIASVTNHDAPPGARVSDRQCASPADTGADTEVSRAGQFTPQQAPQPPKCTERDNFAAAAKCSPAVSETGEGQSWMPTERVTERRPPEPGGGGNVTGLRTERITLQITHDLDAPLGDWIVQVLDESLGFDEYVRVVEEAKLAPAANADGGSNHAASQDAPGWLTAEERRLIEIAVKAQRDPYDITGTSQYNARVLRDLLARSSPPEVVLPNEKHYHHIRDADWLEAIAAAGVTVKEVGRE